MSHFGTPPQPTQSPTTTESDLRRRFGRNVYWHRLEQHLTLRQLEDASGVSFGHIAAIEKATTGTTLKHAVGLAHALDVPLTDLVYGDAFATEARS